MPATDRFVTIGRSVIVALWLAMPAVASAGWYEAVVAELNGNYAKAFIEYKQLADDGDVQAIHNLGVMYYNGYGTYRDYGKAMHCFLVAAEHGVAGAQNNIGYMYAHGYGVRQDFVTARMWFDIAAANGEKTADENRVIVAAHMSRAEIARAGALARQWLEKHPK